MRIWLKEKRREMGLTQTDVAEMAGISRPFYTQIESQTKLKGLSIKTAKSVAKVLDFQWMEFFEDGDDEEDAMYDKVLENSG